MKSLSVALWAFLVFFILVGCASESKWTKPGFDSHEFEQDNYQCEREANIMASQQAGAMSSAVNPLFVYAITKGKFFDNCMQSRGYRQSRDIKEKEATENLDKKIPDEKEQTGKPSDTQTAKDELLGSDWRLIQIGGSSEKEGGESVYASLIFYDASSVVYPSKDIVKVWIKTFKIDKDKSNSFPNEIQARPYETLNSMKLFNITLLEEINCSERKIRAIKGYLDPGVELEREISEDEFPNIFRSDEIRPESAFDKLWKGLCR